MDLFSLWTSAANNNETHDIEKINERLCQLANRIRHLGNNDKCSEATANIKKSAANEKALISALIDIANQLCYELELVNNSREAQRKRIDGKEHEISSSFTKSKVNATSHDVNHKRRSCFFDVPRNRVEQIVDYFHFTPFVFWNIGCVSKSLMNYTYKMLNTNHIAVDFEQEPSRFEQYDALENVEQYFKIAFRTRINWTRQSKL